MALNIVLSAFPSVSDPFSLVTSYVTFKCNSLVQNVIVVYNPQKQSLVIVVLQTRSYQIFLNFGLIHLNIELNVEKQSKLSILRESDCKVVWFRSYEWGKS